MLISDKQVFSKDTMLTTGELNQENVTIIGGHYYSVLETKRKRTFSFFKWRKNNFYPNLVKQNFKVTEKNKLWSIDITHLKKENCFRYLAAIIDCYDKKVVSYQIGEKNNQELIKKTLEKIKKRINKSSNLILHSDRGSQFLSWWYQGFCQKNKITISMNRPRNPIDNAPIESFFASMKKEVLYNQEIKNMDDYLIKINQWIEFYNSIRIRN